MAERTLERFSAEVLKEPLWPHQLEAASSDAFITCIAAARRTGKTTLAEHMAIYTAFANRAAKVIVLSATQDAARRLTESIGATLTANGLTRGSVVEDYATRITLTTGSQIVSLPASQRQVRGYGKDVLLVILDEAGFMPSELWAAARYVALDERENGSRILMVGSPWGAADHFFRKAFEAGQEGDPDHASFHWTFEANPNLDRAYLERERHRTSPAEYAAEVLGEWSDAIGSLFPRELLDRQTADLLLPELSELQPPARGIVGLDYGVSFDRSAACAIYRMPMGQIAQAKPLPRFVVIPHVWPHKTPLSHVVHDVAAKGACFAHVATETNGVGAMPSQELKAGLRDEADLRIEQTGKPPGPRVIYPIATSSASKTAGYGAILALLERGQLILPRHPELLRQLAGLRFEQGERGFTAIAAEDAAVHDDVADALMLAALPWRGPGDRAHRSVLLALANPERAVRDETPGLPAETTRTGAGLEVPRVPSLQSVGGPEVTPGALKPEPEPIEEVGRFAINRRSSGWATQHASQN